MRTILLILVALLAVGCASKPKPAPPQVQSEVEARLREYSAAWFAGDAAGVSSSFTQRNGEEMEFAQSLGRLAVVQRDLLNVQSSVPENIASTVQMSEGVPMITLNRPWHFYAYSASRKPQSMLTHKGTVIAQLIKSGEYTLTLRNNDGKWLIEPSSWTRGRPVSLLTDSIRRQIALTAGATESIRANDWDRLRHILQQMHQQKMVDRISDSSQISGM